MQRLKEIQEEFKLRLRKFSVALFLYPIYLLELLLLLLLELLVVALELR